MNTSHVLKMRDRRTEVRVRGLLSVMPAMPVVKRSLKLKRRCGQCNKPIKWALSYCVDCNTLFAKAKAFPVVNGVTIFPRRRDGIVSQRA